MPWRSNMDTDGSVERDRPAPELRAGGRSFPRGFITAM
jgi:hypothetical protein